MKVLSFNAVRPGTNLVPLTKYALPKERVNGGFLGVFNKKYSGDARKTLFKIALGAIMDTTSVTLGKPARASSPEERSAEKQKKVKLRTWETERAKTNLSHATILKKVNGENPHFALSLPMFAFSVPSQLDATVLHFSAVPLNDDTLAEVSRILEQGGVHTFPASTCLMRAHLSDATETMFGQCVTGVTFKVTDSQTVVYVDFKIAYDEAESMLSMDWIEIRPVDMYPLVSMWVEAEYDSKFYGKSAISLSKISSTLPKHDRADERIDKFNIAIDMAGDPLWIPSQCDNTNKYESMFAAAGTKEDGFCLKSPGGDAPVLPVNIPILVDWVNNKFTYSNTSGKPVTMPLEHMRKCTPSMALNILNDEMPEAYISNLAHYASQLGMSDKVSWAQLPNEPWEAEAVKRMFNSTTSMEVDTYFKLVLKFVREQTAYRDFVPRYIDLTSDSPFELFAPIAVFARHLRDTIIKNLEAVYVRYAVSTITEALGLLSVIVCYGGDMTETRVASNEINKAAENQGVDPNWTPPAAPLLTDKFGAETGGLLPHQAKARNLLRESPDFAMLSVDAGGGKSSLSITDILYEIKENRSAPYLIMCPSHLVANYVSEIVEFTDGKVNCIPVTSYNIRTSGIARYEAILENAPINTILVVDYDVLKFRGRAAVYGTTSIAVYPVIEMLRKFKPGYCMLDESHFLRNAKSARFKSVMSLIADIPKKRLASGTINPDSPSDLPGQVAIMDPTIFGSREKFNNTYGEKVSGGRVLQWRSKGRNSVSDIMTKLKSRVVWVSAKRKEWACALPPRQDRFIPVELSDAQQVVYKAIFDDMVASIRKQAETDKGAKKLLDSLNGKKASAEDEDAFGDLSSEEPEEDLMDDEGDAGPSLQPYLADIERFVTNPGWHPYAKNGFITENGEHVPPLKGDDLLPPKSRVLKELMLTDYGVLDPKNGKVLIFVNYTESARSTFEAMPPEIQACGLLYNTADKTEMVNRFKNDPKIRWMIGIRKSLEVGLNLQQASVLVRLENVWTPGEQEQGDSRIARPYFGPGGDKRPVLKFDTIVANRTIDITKAARLRAKMVALAKFENTNNPAYEAIEDIPIIPMTLDAITNQNDFETNLVHYQSSMADLNRVIKEENESYKAQILSEGGFKFTQVARAETPPGCALLARVPYAQGTELYKASELGLVRVDNYLGMDLSGEEEDEDTDGESDNTGSSSVLDEQRAKIMGMRCHTEYGDGEIIGAGGSVKRGTLAFVRVSMDDGSTSMAKVTASFIVTRSETNGIDMRNKIAKAAGLSVTDQITVPAINMRPTRITQKEIKERERKQQIEDAKKQALFKTQRSTPKMSIGLELNLVNGFIQLGFVIGKNQKAAKALEALGFALNPQYYYTRIRTFKHLITQASNWSKAGFESSTAVDNDTFQALAAEFASNSLANHKHYARILGKANFQNYLRKEWKPNADKKLLNFFALVTDGGDRDPATIKEAAKVGAPPNYGIAYLCLPAGAGHPGSKLAINAKYKAPSSRWFLSDPTVSKFVGNLQGVAKILAELKDAGIQVNNIKELNQSARSVKKAAPKVDMDELEQEQQPKKKRAVEPAPTKRVKAVEPAPTRRQKAVEPAPTRRTKAVETRPVKTRR